MSLCGQQQYIRPGEIANRRQNKLNTRRWAEPVGSGRGAKKLNKNKQTKKNDCVFSFLSAADVLLLRFHSHSCKRCWCSESEGTSLQTPGLDRQVPKVTTTGEEPILPLCLSRPRFSFFVSKNSFAALQSESVCLLFP